MTIPTTINAITETPANTPKPMGNTSNFFPGGLKGVAAAPAFSALAVGDTVGDEVLDNWDKGKGTVEDGGEVSGDGPVLSGCGVAVGFGTEETPMTTTGTSEDDSTTLLVLVLLGGDDIELVTSGKGAEVSVSAGGGTDPELAGGELLTVESGRTVFEGTSVLNGGLTIESPSVVLNGIPPVGGGVFVLLGGTTSDVDENESLELVDVPESVRALELPSSGVTTQLFSSLTTSVPPTTIGVRVIVHV